MPNAQPRVSALQSPRHQTVGRIARLPLEDAIQGNEHADERHDSSGDDDPFTCMRCENFSPTTKICSVFSEVPPPDVIATDVDCKAWVFDGIPW